MFTPHCVAGINSENDDESITNARTMGLRTIRVGWDADWDIATQWSGLTDICALAHDRGLSVDLEIVATKGPKGRQYSDPNVRAMIRSVVPRRTALSLASISFLNEGNHQPFIAAPAAAQWADTMVELKDLVHGIDPTLKTAWGGLSPEAGILSPVPFLKAAALHNPRIAEFTAGGLHPYCYPSDPTIFSDWWNVCGMMDELDTMFRTWRGDGTTIELWLTEFGAPTLAGKAGAYTYSPSAQATWLAKYIEAFARTRASIGRVHYYRDCDGAAVGKSTDREDYMGLRFHDRTAKPTANVYRAFAWSRR